MEQNSADREGYIRQVLEAYRKTPGTMGPSAVRTVSWPRNCINAVYR